MPETPGRTRARDRACAARETAGPDFTLAVDADRGWTAEEADEFVGLVEPLDIHWLEEPCRGYDDTPGMARVRQRPARLGLTATSHFTAHHQVTDKVPVDLKHLVQGEAHAAGFDAVRVTTPAAIGRDVGERLAGFLEAGRHGDMAWIATTAERRRHPLSLWPQARSIVMLGMSYAPASDPLEALADRSRGGISCYAQGKDYHDVVRSGLKRVARTLAEKSGAEIKVFVDTAPLMEKPLAQAAGLGWLGKHTNLVSREFGSWLFLGAILTTAAIEPDAPETDHCGTCTRCLDICPTRAFPAPYQLDARRCIAYLTIEHKGHIAPEFRGPIGNRVFGCDDCLAVCPWNKFAETARNARLAALGPGNSLPLAELLALDDVGFRQRFAGTPVKRTGRDRVVRNALIAAGNAGDRSLLPSVEKLLADGSPLVRAMAAWALGRLADPEEWSRARDRHLPHETDPQVRAEWAEPAS